MDKREIFWNGIEIKYSDGLNSFMVVPFVENAIKIMQKTGTVGKVVTVEVWVETISKNLCADITVVDDGGMEHKHRYMNTVGSVKM